MLTETVAVLDTEKHYEIVNGEMEEKPMAGARQGGISMRLVGRLVTFVEANELGGIYGPDTTFLVGDSQRMPDVSFVRAERIPAAEEPEGLWTFAPDLAVEVISPNDVFDKVMNKVQEYFAAGVQLVWLILPEQRLVIVHRSLTDAKYLTEADELDGGAVLPGFRCHISDLFRSPGRAVVN